MSCRHKYIITNMLPEQIDVTNYIESGEFRPDSSEGKLERLIKVKPLALGNHYEKVLQEKFDKWKTDYNKLVRIKNIDTIDFKIAEIHKSTTYQYSYFALHDPIDVYRTVTEIETKGNKHLNLFIQLDRNGTVLSDYKEDDSWIMNNNEMTQTLTLNYNAISCTCAQWSESIYDDQLDKREYYYLERANNNLINADTLFDGRNFPVQIQVEGKVVTEMGYPKDYNPAKGKGDPAKVFRYTVINVLQNGQKQTSR